MQRDFDFVLRIMKVFAEADSHDGVFWWTDREGERIRMYANCSDFFFWGTADAEEITPENLHLLEEAWEEIKSTTPGDKSGGEACFYVGTLFAAKVRGLRPQGICYRSIPKTIWRLFDACGPERETDFGNPYDQENVTASSDPNA